MKRFIFSLIILFASTICFGQTTVQCSAIAKSTGVQCKNKTKDSSGLCHVHRTKTSASDNKTATKSSVTTEKSDKSTLKSNNNKSQCAAITQKGTRCKRKSEAGSKYCWQHKK